MLTVTLFTTAITADVSTSQRKRIDEAAAVLKEIHAVPDKDIPVELWNKASCVIVVPGLKKAAFVIGGEYGKGLMSCRAMTSGARRSSCRSARAAGDFRSARSRSISCCW
jgi:lipid-binding SYLF domain-containing protein